MGNDVSFGGGLTFNQFGGGLLLLVAVFGGTRVSSDADK